MTPPSDEQITAEAKFYYNQIGSNIIEFGKRLIIMKKRKAHGEWQAWLKDNFNLKVRMAQNFMQCYERFGKGTLKSLLNQTQIFELLALPADETEQFIEMKAAEGTPVEDMTVKKLREEVQQWKDKAEKANEDNERGKEYNVALRKDRDRFKAALHEAEQQLQKQPQVITKPPDDYEQIKQDLAKLRSEKATLQRKLDAARAAEPADYQSTKKRLAELNDKIANMQKQIDEQVSAEDYGNVAHKLDNILSLINDVLNSKNAGRVMADYASIRPDRYNMIIAQFETFIEFMK